jgi:tellurite resistance protein
VFPPPPPPGLWRRTPPAIFAVLFGLMGLALAWRRAAAAGAFGGPPGLAEAVAGLLTGAATALTLFALVAYGVKLLRRPGVLVEDLQILPGRAGVSAGLLSVYLLAVVLTPWLPGLAAGLLVAGMVAHAGLALLVARILLTAPPGASVLTPVLHLTFVGFIIAALAAAGLGWAGLARAILLAEIPVALAIWGASAVQAVRRIPPAPLRPLLAIHVAPAALFATVSADLGMPAMGAAWAVLALAIAAAVVAALRWVVAAGPSPLWGAFTFPAAALASALLAQGWVLAGGLALVAATLIVPPIAFFVLRMWAQGRLAPATNAATA